MDFLCAVDANRGKWDSRTEFNWILQPVLPRQDRFTKTNRRLLRGGAKWSQSLVPLS
jgi:hypothetical protein